MADTYEVESVREVTDVDPESGNLLDFVEAHAKTIPHGVAISVRVPAQGLDTAAVSAALAAKAASVEGIFSA